MSYSLQRSSNTGSHSDRRGSQGSTVSEHKQTPWHRHWQRHFLSHLSLYLFLFLIIFCWREAHGEIVDKPKIWSRTYDGRGIKQLLDKIKLMLTFKNKKIKNWSTVTLKQHEIVYRGVWVLFIAFLYTQRGKGSAIQSQMCEMVY